MQKPQDCGKIKNGTLLKFCIIKNWIFRRMNYKLAMLFESHCYYIKNNVEHAM